MAYAKGDNVFIVPRILTGAVEGPGSEPQHWDVLEDLHEQLCQYEASQLAPIPEKRTFRPHRMQLANFKVKVEYWIEDGYRVINAYYYRGGPGEVQRGGRSHRVHGRYPIRP